MGLLIPALPNVEPRRQSLSFVGAAAAHAAAIGLLFVTGAPQQLAQMVEPIAVRLIELAPEVKQPAIPPPKEMPPPRKPTPVRMAEPPIIQSPVAAEATTTFTVPPAPTLPAPAAAPPAAPIVAARAEPPLTAARFDAAYLANPKPAYPPTSRRLGEEGRVVLRVHVSPDGQPEQIEIKQSSSFGRLDTAARDAVARWRFVPARRGEQSIAAWVLVPIVFNLES